MDFVQRASHRLRGPWSPCRGPSRRRASAAGWWLCSSAVFVSVSSGWGGGGWGGSDRVWVGGWVGSVCSHSRWVGGRVRGCVFTFKEGGRAVGSAGIPWVKTGFRGILVSLPMAFMDFKDFCGGRLFLVVNKKLTCSGQSTQEVSYVYLNRDRSQPTRCCSFPVGRKKASGAQKSSLEGRIQGSTNEPT